MTASRTGNRDDRLFVRNGRRSYRRRHSLREARIGLAILGLLALVAIWVAWRGANPDPALFDASAALLEGNRSDVQMAGTSRIADRGPLPISLAATGWTEGSVSQFDTSNLYEKINGREDYYKAFGFERLFFVSLVQDNEPTRVVDIELFDLGTAPNALGAYAGERPPEISPEIRDGGMFHQGPNALFMTRGRYYVRAIGADTSEPTRSQLDHLERALLAEMAGEPLPWAYALFVGELELDPSRVSYMAENAFSFGFAQHVYAALLEDDETEIFVVTAADETAATQLATRFNDGFLDYGSAAGTESIVPWVKDRYLGGVSGARADQRWVLGVRNAPGTESAVQAWQRLQRGVQDLPPGIVTRALESTTARVDEAQADVEPTGADTEYD